MSNHTPGPWAEDKFALSVEIRSIGNPLIAVVQSRHCESPEEMAANAKLIAAAPMLLEALQKAESHMHAMMAHIDHKPRRFQEHCWQQVLDIKVAITAAQEQK